MSNAPASRPRRSRLLRVVAAIGLLTSLAGCVVVPAGGYYHGGYYHHHYWR
jgi:hypothetical protein